MENKGTVITSHGWHVLYTYPNSEKKVYNNLLLHKIESYLPLQKVVRQWSDRKKTLEVPLFPNYIFVHINKLERFKALSIPGVVKYVSFEGKPVFVRPEEINAIKKLVSGDYSFSIETELIEGDDVRITSGPFAGLKGVFFERKGTKRFGIKISSIDQALSIEVNAACLEKILQC